MNNDRLKWFQAALEEKVPGTSVEDLSTLLRVSPEVFTGHIKQGTEMDSMAGSVIRGILGCSINEFVENGRAICGQEAQPAPGKKTPGSDDHKSLLEKAARILEAGGPQAEALKTIISLMG